MIRSALQNAVPWLLIAMLVPLIMIALYLATLAALTIVAPNAL